MAFDNVLLNLYRELPHEICERGQATRSIEVLRRYGIQLGVLEAVAAESVIFGETAARNYAVVTWACAVPNDLAIETLVRHSPIVEIGAGTGYWARLAAEAGADVVAYDLHRPCWAGNGAKGVGAYFDVRRGGQNAVRQHQERTLFLCWPPYRSGMAMACLKDYEGGTVIYVGEGDGGCTGDDRFHEALERNWECIRMVDIPQWFGMHDQMYVYKRRTNGSITSTKGPL